MRQAVSANQMGDDHVELAGRIMPCSAILGTRSLIDSRRMCEWLLDFVCTGFALFGSNACLFSLTKDKLFTIFVRTQLLKKGSFLLIDMFKLKSVECFLFPVDDICC